MAIEHKDLIECTTCKPPCIGDRENRQFLFRCSNCGAERMFLEEPETGIKCDCDSEFWTQAIGCVDLKQTADIQE